MFFKLANLFMGGAKFLGDVTTSEEDIKTGLSWIENLTDQINVILVPILSVVSALGAIWAIVLGVNMARADSTEKREEAKKRLIGLIVGLVIMIALIVFFLVGFEPMLKAFGLK